MTMVIISCLQKQSKDLENNNMTEEIIETEEPVTKKQKKIKMKRMEICSFITPITLSRK